MIVHSALSRSLRLAMGVLASSVVACVSLQPAAVSIMPAALVPVDADHNKAKDFARVFCSTLTHVKDPRGLAWDICSRYFEPAVDQPERTGAFTTAYRFLLVAGFGDDCLKGVRAFGSSIAHLKDAHQVDIEYFSVPPFGSSEENGKSIARHIEDGWAADPRRRYVLIGYDKGAADLLEALRSIDTPKMKVAALVTVAGVVGGSWVTEDVRALMEPPRPWMTADCPTNLQDGMHSLRRDVRQRFLRENPLEVPGYSLIAVSTADTTSKVLKPAWGRLAAYAVEQDGEMTGWEAILPGAKYLGAAKADHWAIALPFNEMPTPLKGIDRNRYPRDALLEAIVRFVTADLPQARTSARNGMSRQQSALEPLQYPERRA